MKKTLLYAFISILLASSLFAFPTTISYQGKLIDNGSPANGNYNLGFAIFDAPSGGTQLWPSSGNEMHSLSVANGFYTVYLGSINPIQASVFSANDAWLQVTVQNTILPRVQINAVPYAKQAEAFSTQGTQVGDLLMWDGSKWVAAHFKFFYRDADGDGFGDKCFPVFAMTAPPCFVDNNLDCDDNNPNIGAPPFTYYKDADGDGYGNAAMPLVSNSCTPPPGFVANSSDCNDNDPTIHPGANEICDGIDNDCNGLIDDGNSCPSVPNATSQCQGNNGCVFTCLPNWGDCDNNPANGCEVNLLFDKNNCGSCGNVCQSGICMNGVCTSSCNDTIKDGTETDVNCGGGSCPPCANGKQCNSGNDCQSGVCVGGVCQAPSCNDGVKNGNETDVDCGGSCPNKCSDSQQCSLGTDCQSGVCMGGICQVPVCNDGVKNGNETDVDCGGGICIPCSIGKSCNQDNDCQSSVCCGGSCTNVQTDIANCGACGNACGPVQNGNQACTEGQCVIGSCNAGFADCNNQYADGCEVNINADVNNCGNCGHICFVQNGTPGCSGGSCVIAACNNGFRDCNGLNSDGCEVNVNADVNNCGNCGHVCFVQNGTAGCSNGSCVVAACNSGFANCNNNPGDGCEINTQTDHNNCGACGVVCNQFQTCTNGVCQ